MARVVGLQFLHRRQKPAFVWKPSPVLTFSQITQREFTLHWVVGRAEGLWCSQSPPSHPPPHPTWPAPHPPTLHPPPSRGPSAASSSPHPRLSASQLLPVTAWILGGLMGPVTPGQVPLPAVLTWNTLFCTLILRYFSSSGCRWMLSRYLGWTGATAQSHATSLRVTPSKVLSHLDSPQSPTPGAQDTRPPPRSCLPRAPMTRHGGWSGAGPE